jgi:hypothetical protein
VSALVRERITVGNAPFKVEVVVHIFDIGPKYAGEIHACTGHSIKRVPDKTGYIAMANARSGSDVIGKTVEIGWRRILCGEGTDDECTKSK